MAWVHLVARKFAGVLADPDFDLLVEWPYWNRFGSQGHSYYGTCHGRRFCMSQSHQDGADTMESLARVFRNGNSIDTRIGPFYSNRKGQIGLIVAAWRGSQWVQMISPGTPDQPRDMFAALAEKIRADKTFDPPRLHVDRLLRSTDARLQELEDILEDIRGRRDFDW